jgi:hypothetical protein
VTPWPSASRTVGRRRFSDDMVWTLDLFAVLESRARAR